MATFFGATIDLFVENKIVVTLIATGFRSNDKFPIDDAASNRKPVRDKAENLVFTDDSFMTSREWSTVNKTNPPNLLGLGLRNRSETSSEKHYEESYVAERKPSFSSIVPPMESDLDTPAY